MKLAVNTSQLVQRKNVQYNSGFVLPPGQYHLKFVVRENQSGRLGSFETDFTVPDLKTAPVKMSSIVLASQLQPNAKHKTDNPLVHDGSEIIPNVTHVFSAGPASCISTTRFTIPATRGGEYRQEQRSKWEAAHSSADQRRVFSREELKPMKLRWSKASELNAPDRKAAIFQLDVPLTQLKPGFYTCQVNVIDDAAGQFRFPRLALLVRE